MDNVTRLPRPHEQAARADYTHRIYPMPVQVDFTGERETTTPAPQPSWSQTERLRWMLGVVRKVSGVDIELRRAHRERFYLRVGDRPPLTNLTERMTWDVLGGAYELACSLQGVQT